MIKIILKDGTVYENDPSLGWNLDRISDIQDCLRIVGKYCLYTKMTVDFIDIYRDDVKEIIEEGAVAQLTK